MPVLTTIVALGLGLGAYHCASSAADLGTSAAAAGPEEASAQVRLGHTEYKRLNVTEAARWFRKAAEQGNAEGQFYLGVMYARGRGVPHDFSQAAHWFQKAADQGHAGAQCNLGIAYAEGAGVKRDDKQAVQWLQKAAKHGEAMAQARLGEMFADGRG